ncbi:MAG: hypothetical protein QM742_05185 [Aquabacterium sp.]
MYQTPLNLPPSFNPAMLAEMALRGAEQLCCMNVSATSVILQTHASAATVLGLPDWSSLIAATSEQARQAVTTGTEQMVQAAQQAGEVFNALQRSTSEMVEEHSAKAAEALQAGVSDLASQSRKNLEALGEAGQALARRATQAGSDVLDAMPTPDMPMAPLSEAIQETLPEGPNS